MASPASVEDPSFEERIQGHRLAFRRLFGAGEERVFFAPGRVNLMGAHLDYNGGPVMPTAIDRGTFLAVRPRTDGTLRLSSTLEEGVLETRLRELPEHPASAWHDYPVGVVRRMLDGGGAVDSLGADVLFGGNLAIGAGLSSSASICVGTAFALGAAWSRDLDHADCIDAALWGEREFVGVQCGIMDPYAVALTRPGHLLYLDCKDASVQHVPLDPKSVTIAVADTGVRRELAQGEFNRRVAECARAYELLSPHAPEATCLRDIPASTVEALEDELDPPLFRRALHVAQEFVRTREARDALVAGDLSAFGRAITEAHASLRDLFEVSIPELDLLVDRANTWEGVYGARLTGAGFGGCVVILLRTEARAGFVEYLQTAFTERFGIRPTVEFYRSGSGLREIS